MPLFVFRCPECGQEVEELRTVTRDVPIKICDCKLGGVTMENVVTAPAGFRLKGSGFHSVDYPKER